MDLICSLGHETIAVVIDATLQSVLSRSLLVLLSSEIIQIGDSSHWRRANGGLRTSTGRPCDVVLSVAVAISHGSFTLFDLRLDSMCAKTLITVAAVFPYFFRAARSLFQDPGQNSTSCSGRVD